MHPLPSLRLHAGPVRTCTDPAPRGPPVRPLGAGPVEASQGASMDIRLLWHP